MAEAGAPQPSTAQPFGSIQDWTSVLQGEARECLVCAHHCMIKPGAYGRCGVRQHVEGGIQSLVYGHISALAHDPVEKKPLYHVMPGSSTFSVALGGCNFRCAFCQNHTLSQVQSPGSPDKVLPTIRIGRTNPQLANLSPQNFLDRYRGSGCPSVSFTYAEPTVWVEWMLDCAGLVKEAGGKVFLVSNGFFSPQVRERLLPLVDAYNIDLKGSDGFYRQICSARVEPVLENIRALQDAWSKRKGGLLEVTTLVLDTWHNKEVLDQLASWLQQAGIEIWHLSRFFPAWHMSDQEPTPEGFIDLAVAQAREAGIPFVYGGNIRRNYDTQCPSCGRVLIRRNEYGKGVWIDPAFTSPVNPPCPGCGRTIPLLLA